jgi:hypothetical protein
MLRDVILVPNKEGRLMTNRPRLPVDIGRDVRLERLDGGPATRIMDACVPHGYKASPSNLSPLFSQRYAFVREGPPSEPAYEWDSDNRLQECVGISRLIRPTSIGFEYSARLECGPGGDVRRIIPGPVRGFGAEAWIVPTSHGDYLDEADVTALAELWQKTNLSSLPDRLQRALWYHEYAARTRLVPIRWVLITTGIETLINTAKDRVSKQFTVRFPALAQRFAGLTVSATKAGKAYGLRSEISHGTRLHDLRGEHLDLYRLLEEVLRATLRAAMTRRDVQGLFSTAEAVEKEWPVPDTR